MPAASALRQGYPDAHLAWLVEPASASLLGGVPWLDEVLVFPRPELRAALRRGRPDRLWSTGGSWLRALRAERFDLVVDFHSILKSGALAWLSGARRRVAYAKPFAREAADWFATERAHLAPPRQSRFQRNEALVRYLGVSQPALARPLVLSPERVEQAAKALGPGPLPIAIHPGTSDATAHKRWTVQGYAEVARALAGEGIPAVVTAGPARDDRDFADAVVAAAGGGARRAPETPTLLDLAALFQACRLYLGGDTGPLHVASLVGTPVVQLIGPTDPVENQPSPATPSRTVRVQIGCNPCRRGCAAASCMRAITPDSVIKAARELLAGEGGQW
ncbi:MAG: glycosyltransferase family 9 protein [Deltaproteobacteria bacterium]|nr:glycosyltransferase family 9 protein [Deltaproteobacteria bacterium]